MGRYTTAIFGYGVIIDVEKLLMPIVNKLKIAIAKSVDSIIKSNNEICDQCKVPKGASDHVSLYREPMDANAMLVYASIMEVLEGEPNQFAERMSKDLQGHSDCVARSVADPRMITVKRAIDLVVASVTSRLRRDIICDFERRSDTNGYCMSGVVFNSMDDTECTKLFVYYSEAAITSGAYGDSEGIQMGSKIALPCLDVKLPALDILEGVDSKQEWHNVVSQ